MIINSQQITALLPLLILIFTITIVLFSISCNRNHCFVAMSSISGLIASFCSLYLTYSIVPKDITMLFHMTKYSIFGMEMILLSSIITCIFSYPWLMKSRFNKEEFYVLILISTLGSLALIISDHMSSLFVNIEIISLPIFGLMCYSHYYKYSLESALKYIILSGVTSSFLLMGIAWIYSISGSLNFISISNTLNISSVNEIIVILFGISMILMSFCFKLAIFPFHLWIADIYQGTPALVLSFFSNASKISIIFVLLHFVSCVFLEHNKILYNIIFLMTFFSMIFGNLMAMFQNNIKRLFGYTAISQIGYLFIVLLASKQNYSFSLEALGIYLLSYFFSNIVFFGVISFVSNPNYYKDIDTMDSYRGLFWKQPLLTGMITIVLLSLAGVPTTLGFIGKFYLLSIILKEKLWILGISFFLGTVLGLYCYLRIMINLYLNPIASCTNHINVSNNWLYTYSGIVICISGTILLALGIYPNPVIKLVQLYVY